ncbi:unnamed protein product [Malus baccata var. baccata]
MSWHLQKRNHHQFRKKKLSQLRIQQLLLHLKLMLRQKSLKVRMPTKSGLGHLTHHKEVAFPRRAALLLSTILFLGHHSQPSIQDIHRQGTRIVQNLHLTPSLGLICSEAHKILDFFLNQKHSEDFESMRSNREFDQGHGFPTFDDIPDPFGSLVPFRSSLDSQTPRRDLDPFGSSGPFRMALDSQTPRKNQIFSSLQCHFGHHSTVITPRGDSDAFGSTPFRTSFDGQTPRRDLDPFGSSGPFRMTMETPRKD